MFIKKNKVAAANIIRGQRVALYGDRDYLTITGVIQHGNRTTITFQSLRTDAMIDGMLQTDSDRMFKIA